MADLIASKLSVSDRKEPVLNTLPGREVTLCRRCSPFRTNEERRAKRTHEQAIGNR